MFYMFIITHERRENVPEAAQPLRPVHTMNVTFLTEKWTHQSVNYCLNAVYTLNADSNVLKY